MELSERVDALERRVLAVEQVLGDNDDDGPGPVPTGDWWLLEGLRERMADSQGLIAWGGRHDGGSGTIEWQITQDTSEVMPSDDQQRRLVADRLAALGHPSRLSIMEAVISGTHKVAELTEQVGLGTSGQMYHHINALSAAGWLRSNRRGYVEVPADRLIPALVACGLCR